MKKSELKEMIRQAMLAETEEKKSVNEERKLTYNDFVRMVRDDMMVGAAPDEYPSDEDDERIRKDAKYLYNRYLQGASVDDLFEATKEEEVADEIEVEDTETDTETDTEMSSPELDADNQEILNNLEAALKAAKQMGDEKLVNQIGNTITFFTRAHIVKEEDLFETKRMKRLAGILK